MTHRSFARHHSHRFYILRECPRAVNINITLIDGNIHRLAGFNQAVCESINDRFSDRINRNLRYFDSFQSPIEFHPPVHRFRNVLNGSIRE